MALAAIAIGFTSAQFATARALPQPSLPSHATILTGKVRSVEALVEGRRIAIDGARLDGGDALKRWLRVRLKKGDTEEIATGDMIRRAGAGAGRRCHLPIRVAGTYSVMPGTVAKRVPVMR